MINVMQRDWNRDKAIRREVTVRWVCGLLAPLLMVASGGVLSQVQVHDPWVRATVATQKSSGAYMHLASKDDARLVSVSSTVAGVVEIHEMALVDNVMRMRAVPGIDIRAGKGAELKPGGYHLMLLELKRQLKEGESIPLTLVIEGRDKKRTTIAVNAEVRPLQTPAKSAKAHEHANH